MPNAKDEKLSHIAALFESYKMRGKAKVIKIEDKDNNFQYRKSDVGTSH
jgi:hypothetical protein